MKKLMLACLVLSGCSTTTIYTDGDVNVDNSKTINTGLEAGI